MYVLYSAFKNVYIESTAWKLCHNIISSDAKWLLWQEALLFVHTSVCCVSVGVRQCGPLQETSEKITEK